MHTHTETHTHTHTHIHTFHTPIFLCGDLIHFTKKKKNCQKNQTYILVLLLWRFLFKEFMFFLLYKKKPWIFNSKHFLVLKKYSSFFRKWKIATDFYTSILSEISLKNSRLVCNHDWKCLWDSVYEIKLLKFKWLNKYPMNIKVFCI